MSDDWVISESVRHWHEYYEKRAITPVWGGRACHQFPADLFRYAYLCHELRPPFVVEIGTYSGGTAMFLADIMAGLGGIVIAIDINDPKLPSRDNLHFLYGSSTYPAIFDQVVNLTDGHRGLVLIDGDHSSDQVLQELDMYSDLADYMVVQDTIMQYLDIADNPLVALNKWYPAHSGEFEIDIPGDDVTQHPGGWLRRKDV